MQGFAIDTTRQIVRDIMKRVDIPDPHEFATAYVNHAESIRAQRGTPMPVAVAVQRWLSLRTV